MKKMMIWRNLKKQYWYIWSGTAEVSLHWLGKHLLRVKKCRSCNRYTVWNTKKNALHNSASLKTVQEIRLFFLFWRGDLQLHPHHSNECLGPGRGNRKRETRQRLTVCSSLIEKDRKFAVLSSSHFFMPSFFSMLLTIACKVIKNESVSCVTYVMQLTSAVSNSGS